MQTVQEAGRRADAGGIDTFYLEEGAGPPIVLIHGGGAGADSWGNWRNVIPRLSSDRRVIAVDMVGFGHTAKPNGDFVYSQPARVRHMIAFLDALDVGPATLVGNSMGGATAIGVAVERPDLVSKLILMGSAGLVTRIDPALAPILKYDFTREGMVRLVRALTTDSFRIDDEMIDYRYELSVQDDTRRAYSATMAWIAEQGGLFWEEDYIRRISVPTLVVNGKCDKVVPVGQAYRFLELIDNSWGYLIPDCGHWAMIEHPDDFARITRSFADA
ncbi:alpha/beta fold hydrolase [Sphingomonas adhaesiva]|uniref:Alpha/beta hydrolase n=1 Tax=Sphingomonas adhaesiva TaxID=28212 RepID=A0A2A4I4L3_9SPHN|nr:alpha/beta hydrolase [Sphingomonas adhaesiva]PCG13096.1 alpha/beta hydrolase [Sphingomonas adhaesiva]